jgi:hypothetical protein
MHASVHLGLHVFVRLPWVIKMLENKENNRDNYEIKK